MVLRPLRRRHLDLWPWVLELGHGFLWQFHRFPSGRQHAKWSLWLFHRFQSLWRFHRLQSLWRFHSFHHHHGTTLLRESSGKGPRRRKPVSSGALAFQAWHCQGLKAQT